MTPETAMIISNFELNYIPAIERLQAMVNVLCIVTLILVVSNIFLMIKILKTKYLIDK